MANVYKWTIPAMDCYPTSKGQSTVVFNVHWICIGDDGVANTSNTGIVMNTQPLVYEEGQPFTPYENLNTELVVGWIKSVMGESAVNEIYANIDTQIANKQNPPIITLPMPN